LISISFQYPKELEANATIRRALYNAANFVRDLWLARSPYATGDYAKGLQHTQSVQVSGGQIKITNFSKHASVIEYGFKGYNIGLAMLNSGKNVKVAADGNRYKMIHIDPKPRANYRQAGVASAVVKSFTKMAPIGMPIAKLTKYGQIKPYKSKPSLKKPIKGKPALASSPRGFLVISEKAIKADPKKWMMPSRAGMKLAEKLQKEARPFVLDAIKLAVKQERERQERMRKGTPNPKLKTDMRKLIQSGPVIGVRK